MKSREEPPKAAARRPTKAVVKGPGQRSARLSNVIALERVAKDEGDYALLVLSGPNLQRLGKRQPEIYGRQTLEQIHERLRERASELGVALDCRQTNHEGTLVDWIGSAQDDGFAGIVINPGAYTHTSYALYDALIAAGIPSVEVHLSNPEAREPFRRHSCTAPACLGTVAGVGAHSYLVGLDGLVQALEQRANSERQG